MKRMLMAVLIAGPLALGMGVGASQVGATAAPPTPQPTAGTFQLRWCPKCLVQPEPVPTMPGTGF